MESEVRTLRPGEAPAAARLLARAFARDPILTHFLHDPVRRQVALPAFFESVLEELLPSGQVFELWTGGERGGIAAWLPPDQVEPDEQAQERVERARLIVQSMFPLTSAALFEGVGALLAEHPAEPHWYLVFVGIEPARQGQGLGRALLAPVLNVADETGTICYLETPFPRTHAFYESLGFTRRAEVHAFAGASGLTTFIRQPQGRSSGESGVQT